VIYTPKQPARIISFTRNRFVGWGRKMQLLYPKGSRVIAICFSNSTVLLLRVTPLRGNQQIDNLLQQLWLPHLEQRYQPRQPQHHKNTECESLVLGLIVANRRKCSPQRKAIPYTQKHDLEASEGGIVSCCGQYCPFTELSVLVRTGYTTLE